MALNIKNLKSKDLEDEYQTDLVNDGKMRPKYEVEIVWRNVILFGYLHLSSIYGTYLIFTSAKFITTLFAFLLIQMGLFGITAGAHRLWAHHTYKAKWPLQLLLILCNTIAFQDAVIDWVRDHRMHHKFVGTDADPHNSSRGFFFSHIGWLLCRKHPDLKEKGKCVNLRDLKADPLICFQKRYYMILMPLISLILPTFIPWYFWNETLSNAWHVSTLWRYTVSLHFTWTVNSVAHLWGTKPYDRTINPVENIFVSLIAMGEGWHNYHHAFPWDYKTAEIGHWCLNYTTFLINMFAKIGWASNLRTVSDDVLRERIISTGDGTHSIISNGLIHK